MIELLFTYSIMARMPRNTSLFQLHSLLLVAGPGSLGSCFGQFLSPTYLVVLNRTFACCLNEQAYNMGAEYLRNI